MGMGDDAWETGAHTGFCFGGGGVGRRDTWPVDQG